MSLKKRKFFKVFRWIFYVFAFVFFLFIGLVNCMPMRLSDEKIVESMKEKVTDFSIEYIAFKEKKIRYVETGNKNSDTVVLFVHGAPGGLDASLSYLQNADLIERARLISFDRLGYGYSHYGEVVPSLKEQAESLEGFLALYPDKKFVLVGHSFGGPIAAYAAYLYSERVSDLVLLGSASDPAHERFVFWAKLPKIPPLKWLFPKGFLVASDEKIAHPKELEKMKHIWPKLEARIHIFHGKKDWIVPYENAISMQSWLEGVDFCHLNTFPKKGHIFYITEPEILSTSLIETLDGENSGH